MTKLKLNNNAMNESTPLHVILGAGQIGMLLADRLLASGFRVRLVRRGPPGAERENLSWARGDLRDRNFAEAATRGAVVVYQCSEPPYEKWLDELMAGRPMTDEEAGADHVGRLDAQEGAVLGLHKRVQRPLRLVEREDSKIAASESIREDPTETGREGPEGEPI